MRAYFILSKSQPGGKIILAFGAASFEAVTKLSLERPGSQTRSVGSAMSSLATMSMHMLATPGVLRIGARHQSCASIDTGDIMRELMDDNRGDDFA